MLIGPVVNDAAKLSFPLVITKGHRGKGCIQTHIVDVLVLDRNLSEEVKIGELDPVLLDCLWIILFPNLGEGRVIVTDGCEVGYSLFGPGQAPPANRE